MSAMKSPIRCGAASALSDIADVLLIWSAKKCSWYVFYLYAFFFVFFFSRLTLTDYDAEST